MKLSVVIVSYNVKYFLDPCLISVYQALEGIEGEILVVDNASADGSAEWIQKYFPRVHLIKNNLNAGFAKANNQALKMAKGEYVLLLNPDTIVAEDTFLKCLHFMDNHPDAGAMGVKMIDGSGKFLPESKRAIPTPLVAFYKIFGLTRVFPSSPKFSRYYLGSLDKNKTQEIEVLTGAFMFIRQTCLSKTGFFDESYFMYGEDIDLSLRIKHAGYNLYYFPESVIIHYKGESTKKGSINYIRHFYKSMKIFADKHFSRSKTTWFQILIQLAIYSRAILTAINQFIKKVFLPLSEFSLLLSGLFVLRSLWEQYRFQEANTYPAFIFYHFIVYSIIWVFTVYFYGGYDKPLTSKRFLKGMGYGTIVILVGYSLLPEYLRFSRAIIILGFLSGSLVISGYRFMLKQIKIPSKEYYRPLRKNILLLGEGPPSEDTLRLIKENQRNYRIVIASYTKDQPTFSSEIIKKIKGNRINEILFHREGISVRYIIELMQQFSNPGLQFKIFNPWRNSFVGSHSSNYKGELYTLFYNSISLPFNRRKKRLLDMLISLITFVLLPFLGMYKKSYLAFFRACISIIMGKKSWVGYVQDGVSFNAELPQMKPGIFTPADAITEPLYHLNEKNDLNINYARDYKMSTDVEIILKGFSKMVKS